MKRESVIRNVARWFRLTALAEAISWVGLLIGMYFKHLHGQPTEIGVKIFGPTHGALFVAYLLAVVVAGIAFRWHWGTWLLALLGGVLPLGSVIFVIWADRRGKLARPAAPARAVDTVPTAT